MISKHFTGVLIASALIFAGVFCVTFTTLTQSLPLLLFFLAGILVFLQSLKGNYSGNQGLKILTLITVIYFLVRAYLSPVSSLARQDMFLIASGAMLYSYLGILMPSKVLRRWITAGFIGIMLVNLLNWIPVVDQWRDSIIQYANGEPNTGLFHHRNFYGNFMFMMTCLCLSLALFSNKQPMILRFSLAFLALCGGVSVILATARSSFLALAVGVSVLIACYLIVKGVSAEKKQKPLFVSAGLGLMLMMGIGLVVGGKFILKERSKKFEDSTGRTEYFALSLDQIPDAPILGSGSRSVEYKSYEYWPMEMNRVIQDFRFVHNEFLQSVTDYGLVGFLLLLAVFIWHLINGILLLYHKSMAKRSHELTYVVAGISILMGLCVNMLFSFPMHGFVNLLLIVFAATMLLGGSGEREIKSKLAIILKPISLLTVISLLVYSAIEGGKEFVAGKAFWKQGIVGDDLYWEQDEETDDQWEAALRDALAVSPTYVRYNRLGEIFMARQQLDEAYDAYSHSKDMHPYSPTSRISLARIYILKGQFNKAEKEFKEVEYLVKNREPLFNYYRYLAEFYLGWAKIAPESRSDLLVKAREATDTSVKKRGGYIDRISRKSIVKVLQACYEDLIQQQRYQEAYKLFDELVVIGRGLVLRTDEDAEFLMWHAKEILKHANFSWNKGLMKRSAKYTYRGKAHYHKYFGYKDRKVNQNWIIEEKRINEALQMFQQAGIEIDKK